MGIKIKPINTKVKMAAPAARTVVKDGVAKKGTLMYRFLKWKYYKSYFPELGLRTDDTWLVAGHYKPIIQEALRRIPKEEMDARNFRLARANQLVLQKSVLPREEWTDFDTDKPYLVPYIKEVEAELAEKRDWDSKQ